MRIKIYLNPLIALFLCFPKPLAPPLPDPLPLKIEVEDVGLGVENINGGDEALDDDRPPPKSGGLPPYAAETMKLFNLLMKDLYNYLKTLKKKKE